MLREKSGSATGAGELTLRGFDSTPANALDSSGLSNSGSSGGADSGAVRTSSDLQAALAMLSGLSAADRAALVEALSPEPVECSR